MENAIKEKTTIEEILSVPGADLIMEKYGLPCLGCPMLQFEMGELTIGEACDIYQIDKKKLIADLNKIWKRKTKKSSKK